jgi:hypothetical protein
MATPKIVFSLENITLYDTTSINATDASLATSLNPIDLGKTIGGATFTQTEENVEIMSDQSADPEAIVSIRAPKEITITLRSCDADNLALAFGGTAVDSSTVLFPSGLPANVEKAMSLTTRASSGLTQLKFNIARARIAPSSTLEFNTSDGSSLELTCQVLAPETGTSGVGVQVL